MAESEDAMREQKAREIVEILIKRLNESTNLDYRCGLSFAIGVVEGVFMLNCNESLDQSTADDEAARDFELLQEGRTGKIEIA